MENTEKKPDEKPGFMGGFGFLIVIIGGVILLLVALKLLIG